VSGIAAQVTEAISQKAQYVVILIGANDVCAKTFGGMTPVATFSKTIAGDLATLFKALPKTHVTLYSIPNLFQLWSILHNNASAEQVWSIGQICQSMLSQTNTANDRALVLARERADNSALAAACKKHTTCKWDNFAVFDTKFTPSDVNTFDYFHPSVIGQNRLAAITWAASWWPKSK
jgi:lysophospholipase L1-like esterase